MIQSKNMFDHLIFNFDIRLAIDKAFQIRMAYSREKVDDPVIRLDQYIDLSLVDCLPELFAKRLQKEIEPVFSDSLSRIGLIEFEYNNEWYVVNYDFVEFPEGIAVGRLALSSVESRTDWLILQRNLALRLSQASDLESVFSYIIRVTTQTGYMDAGGIYLFDTKENILNLRYSYGLSENFVKSVQTYQPESDQWKLVMAGRPTFLDDSNLPPVIKESLFKEGIKSFASIPLISQGKVIGAMNLASFQHNKITIIQKRFMENLASLLGDSIKRIQKQQKSATVQFDYLQLLKSLPECLIIIDFEGVILFINQAICDRLGYAVDELEGRNISTLYLPDQQYSMFSILNDLINKKIDHFSNSMLARNGEIIDIETSCGYGNLDFQNVIILSCRKLQKQKQTPDFNVINHLEKIIELMPLPTLIIDSKTLDIEFANLDFYNKFGIHQKNHRLSSFLQLFDPHEHERLSNLIRQQSIYGLKNSGSWTLLHHNGALIDTSFFVNRIPWLEKDICVVNLQIQPNSGFTNNVIQAARYQDVVDEQLDLICRISLNGMLTFVNNAYCEFFNLKPEDAIGKTVSFHAFPDDLPKVRKKFRDISIENPIQNSQNRMVDGKGRTRWVNWSDRGIFKDGQLVEIQGVGRDITEDMLSKFSSPVIENRYQLLIEEMPVVVYVYHATTYHPIYMSPQSLMLSGYSVEEIYQTNDFLKKIIHPDDIDIVVNGYAKRIEGEKNLPLRYRILHKDGHVIWLQDLGAVIESEDGTRLLQGIVMDVSIWKLAEEKLLILEQFEGLFNDIKQKVANVSIEQWPTLVNYILRVIGGLIEVDRSYVFEINNDQLTMSNTYEWCGDGIEPQIDNLKDLPISDFQYWINTLIEKEIISFSNIEKIPEQETHLREFLKAQNILSILVVPMKKQGKLFGYMGFDSVVKEVEWSEQAIFLLRMISDILLNGQERLFSQD